MPETVTSQINDIAQVPKEKVVNTKGKQEKMAPAEKAMVIGYRFVDSYDIIWYNQDFYHYEDGLWHLLDTYSIEAKISEEYIQEFGAMNRNQIKEVIMFMKTRTYSSYGRKIKEIFEEAPTGDKLNLRSGIFDIRSRQTKPYEKEDFVFYCLPLDFKEEITLPVNFYRLLTTSMGFEWDQNAGRAAVIETEAEREDFFRVISFIQEWMGYSLISGNKLHRNLIMYGSGRNGKGVLQEVWSAMLGEHNVSKLDLKHVNDPVMISRTKNKLINFSYDLDSGQQLDTGIVKAASAGEWVTGRELYKNPTTFRFTAKLVIACNELPYVRNMGPAIRERFYILPFMKQFEGSERDPDLKDKIIATELPDIFSWAVEGLKRLMERGDFEPPERCVLAQQEFAANYDIIQQWIDDNGLDKGNKHDRCRRSWLWTDFHSYANDSGVKYQKARFFNKLREKGYSLQHPGNIYYYYGLTPPNNASQENF